MPFLAVGAVGVIGVATHWIGERAGQLFEAFEAGDLAEARRINAELLPSFDFETSDEAPNPLPTKALMRALGHPVGQCRLPMGVAPSGLDERASTARRSTRPGGLSMAAPVKVTFLGGLGEIGRNCAAIEVEGRILLIDCGLMFPDADMLGIDLVLPDFTWLRENADRIEGCIATHGHEDHVGGLSYLLRELSFPIYGSALTLGLARNRIEEAGLLGRTEFIPVADGERRQIGPVRLRVHPRHPLGARTASPPRSTPPQGTILHTGDFKLDLTPVDGRLTDLSVMGAIAENEGIRLLLSDSTNADAAGPLALRDVGRQGARSTCSPSTRVAASSPPASPATSTACSRSPMPPSPTTAWSPRSACR